MIAFLVKGPNRSVLAIGFEPPDLARMNAGDAVRVNVRGAMEVVVFTGEHLSPASIDIEALFTAEASGPPPKES